jgi:hypothetical protein
VHRPTERPYSAVQRALQSEGCPTVVGRRRATKRIANVVLVVGALSAAFLLGQTAANFDKWWTPGNDALAAAPQNHRLLFENDAVRVLAVTIQPGVREPLHTHPYPSVLCYISAAHMKEYSPGIAASASVNTSVVSPKRLELFSPPFS